MTPKELYELSERLLYRMPVENRPVLYFLADGTITLMFVDWKAPLQPVWDYFRWQR